MGQSAQNLGRGFWRELILSTTIFILILVATILITSSPSGESNALLLSMITGQHKHGWWVADNSELSLRVSHYKYTSLPLITSQLYTTCQVPRLRRSWGYVFSLWNFQDTPAISKFGISQRHSVNCIIKDFDSFWNFSSSSWRVITSWKKSIKILRFIHAIGFCLQSNWGKWLQPVKILRYPLSS